VCPAGREKPGLQDLLAQLRPAPFGRTVALSSCARQRMRSESWPEFLEELLCSVITSFAGEVRFETGVEKQTPAREAGVLRSQIQPVVTRRVPEPFR